MGAMVGAPSMGTEVARRVKQQRPARLSSRVHWSGAAEYSRPVRRTLVLARHGAHGGAGAAHECPSLSGTLQAEALHSLEHALHPRRPWNEDKLRLQSLAHEAGAPAAADTYSSASSETEASCSAFR